MFVEDIDFLLAAEGLLFASDSDQILLPNRHNKITKVP